MDERKLIHTLCNCLRFIPNDPYLSFIERLDERYQWSANEEEKREVYTFLYFRKRLLMREQYLISRHQTGISSTSSRRPGQNQEDKVSVSYLSSNTNNNNKRHIECYNCHEFGHYANNCPKYNPRRDGPVRATIDEEQRPRMDSRTRSPGGGSRGAGRPRRGDHSSRKGNQGTISFLAVSQSHEETDTEFQEGILNSNLLEEEVNYTKQQEHNYTKQQEQENSASQEGKHSMEEEYVAPSECYLEDAEEKWCSEHAACYQDKVRRSAPSKYMGFSGITRVTNENTRPPTW